MDDFFSFFGENYPMFSSVYGGLGFTNDFVNASVLVGMEYIWLFTESSRWIPVHYKPRVETRADIGNFSTTFVYENAEYQNKRKKETGERTEVNGSIIYKCGESCRRGMLQGLPSALSVMRELSIQGLLAIASCGLSSK